MTGPEQAAIGVAGTLLAGSAGGPLSQVFGEMTLVMGIMGAFGGSASALAVKLPYSQVVRPAILGSLMAMGFGVLGPLVLSNIFGLEIANGTSMPPILAGSAFAIGFTQERVIKRFLKEEEEK